MKAMQRPVYLDYNATTPLDPRVLDAMLPFFKEAFGNASSTAHAYGWEAAKATDAARKQVASAIKAQPNQIFWTSGATESNNMALLGVMESFGQPEDHLITSEIEHKAVLDVAKALAAKGYDVSLIKPDHYGQIAALAVEAALKPTTRLVSIMLGQNEIGTINPIREIGALLRQRGILFHVDAAQALGKVAIDVDADNVDLLSGSGHKIYGPKGVGFLYIGPRAKPKAVQFGGTQEKGLRPGTLNVPAIVGMGLACEIAEAERPEETARLTELRDHFISRVLKNIPGAKLNGHPSQRLANNISISLTGVSPELFPLGLSGLAVSSGSACSGGATSYVLKAIGHDDTLASASIRIGLGRYTKPEDLELAYNKIKAMADKSRL